MPTLTFLPSGKTVVVPSGTRLSEACRQAGFRISTPCGDKGLCGKCRVRALAGEIPAIDDRQRACLPERLLGDGWRASCIARILGDLAVADPAEDAGDDAILTDFLAREPSESGRMWIHDAVLPPPTTGDQRSDCERLLDAAAPHAPAGTGLLPPAPGLLADLPEALRGGGFRCRTFWLGGRLLGARKSSDPSRALGVAVDIGTTTLAATLCDLATGETLAVASAANPQAVRGDDVISRIEYAARGPNELEEMRALIVKALADLCASALKRAGLAARPLFVAVGANTVMNHLLLGVPPAALAQSPFIPAFRGAQTFAAGEIGWPGPRPPLLHVLPAISAYVGGDIVAGILAHDIHRRREPTLFLDVGTNGEIVLAADGRLLACATAAGPAFEGARISQGMRAVPGAISRVGVTEPGGIDIGTVDSLLPARGVCGTGLLDAVATLLRTGVLDAGGRLRDAAEIREESPGVPPGILGLVDESGDEPAFWLDRPAGRGGHGVRLTQRDIREFQLAKGAIAAGVKVLLDVAGLRPGDVGGVLLAGGFGNYLDPAAAIDVGLLPAGIAPGRVRSVGNASLAGTRLCLLSEDERREAERIADMVEYVELSGRDGFQEAFAEEMLFPEEYGET